MLKYWHVSLLVLIALIWKVPPASSSMDVCDLSNSNASMYCTCEEFNRDDMEITCYAFGKLSESGEVWSSFRRHENTVAFTIQPRESTQLEFIPVQALQNMPSLVTLTIQESNIQIVQSGTIADLPKLRKLNLMRNGFVTLELHAISNLPKLKKLALSENVISKLLADTFSGLDELEELYLDRNNITVIEDCAFCNLHSLKEMELWKNNIEYLTERTFTGLRYLLRLDLFSNQMKSIEGGVFASMPRLRELDLKNNSIQYISPHAFDGLEDLTMLKLSGNMIMKLPDKVFHPLPKLMHLDLSVNKIEIISEELLDNIHNARHNHFMLMLKNNTLICRCELAWLSRWIEKVKNPRFEQDLRVLKCTSAAGEVELIHELKLKPCSKLAKKTAKNVPEEPTTSTLSSYSKERTSFNAKFEEEYADDVQNHTRYGHPVTVLSAVGSTGSASASSISSVLLLCIVAFRFI